jgi:hypothetical protein
MCKRLIVLINRKGEETTVGVGTGEISQVRSGDKATEITLRNGEVYFSYEDFTDFVNRLNEE